MEKIVIGNETYYYNDQKFYDEYFCLLDKTKSDEVALNYFEKVNYTLMNTEQLTSFISNLKEAALYTLAIDVCEYGFKKFEEDYNFAKYVVPILTSVYRLSGKPSESIKTYEKYSYKYHIQSVPLFTSVAAAYCDLGDFKMARKFANRAYALQGGSVNYVNELSLVYQRIKKAEKQD